MKRNVWGFITSSRRDVYFKLALRHSSTPWRVYSLAHGRFIRTSRDARIAKDLERLGIIESTKKW